MRRDLSRLETDEFDLLIVGGGIYGACVAWDAALRGLRVALIEKRDFGSGTTANSLRIAHGGLRSMHRLAVSRLREAAREQAILFRIAPGLVQPLPCVVPIYRSGPGRLAFQSAFAVSGMLTADVQRAYGNPLPAPRIISPEETLTCFAGFESSGLRGGALWYDAQVPEIERLVLAYIISAAERGALIANYVRARRLVIDRGVIVGAEATDQRTGSDLRIRAGTVVNAAGPWCEDIVQEQSGWGIPHRWATGVNIVLDRPPLPVAIGVRSPWGSERDPVMGGHRHLFMTGWKGMTLAGTSYRFTAGAPSLQTQVEELVAEWNAACPALQLGINEVTHAHAGRLPLREGIQPGRPTALLEQGTMVHHEKRLPGLITLVSAKFTTARRWAERAVDVVATRRGRPVRSMTRDVPLTIPGPDSSDLEKRVRHAIRDEMAHTLEDLVVRRLGLGLTACPPISLLGKIADTAALELGWTSSQTDEEIQSLLGTFLPGSVTRAA